MADLSVRQKKLLMEIEDWVNEYGQEISYFTLLDLLQFENQPIADDQGTINMIIRDLENKGIRITTEEEEPSYGSENSNESSFVPASVNITPVMQNVSNLMERLANEEIDLNPDFQRRRDLWDDVRQSRLIESLMLRIPIPNFYFDMSKEENWIVIDGLQRLTTFKNYLVGEREISSDGSEVIRKRSFVGLQYLRDFNGLTFDQLPRQYMRRIKEAGITVYGVMKGTPESITYNIFQRINTGGIKLESQEIRNAMYHGKATELANVLAKSDEFLAVTLYAVSSARMLDQEYVIRFMAFTELDYRIDYKDDIDAFLIKTMKRINQYDEENIERLRLNFIRVMRYAKCIFGDYAFRRMGENKRKGPLNKALFEIFSVCFSKLSNSDLDRIVNNRNRFLEQYEQLFQEKEFVSALRSGSRSECIKRIDRGERMIREFLC